MGGDGAAGERAGSKSRRLYRNARWDLVDKSKEEGFKWSEVDKGTLPEELRELSDEELQAYVDKKSAEREQIQEKIRDLAEKRDAFVKEELAKNNLDESDSFDLAVRESIEKQAEDKGFSFEE